MASKDESPAYLSAQAWGARLGISTGRARQLLGEHGQAMGARRLIHGRLVLWEVPETAKDPRQAWGRPKKATVTK